MVLVGAEYPPQCLRQVAAPSPRVVDGGLEEEWDKACGHYVLPDLVERKVPLHAVAATRRRGVEENVAALWADMVERE